MTNEKLNNNNAWQAKLEDTDALQEYTLPDKNAVWESLYGKLNKEHRPKFFWYQMAAASIIAVVTIISFLRSTNNNNVVQQPSVKLQQQHVVPGELIEKAVIEKTNAPHPIAKIKSTRKKIEKPFKQIAEIPEIEITGTSQTQPVLINEAKTVPPVLKDSVVKTPTIIAKAPKRLKIVHANELDNEGSCLNMAESRIPARIKIFNQDIYTDYTLAAHNTGAGISILKHKTSPN
ncbi:hypothetical protein [Parafilimonas terrae]|jgi:hypothetical protein|uniref:Uncharacterized protein n=1 Tax=Parafilimonas terrae TaxID=1465490 RepID=A0A1I5YZW8_9BACT|nr:hypothetical protein [Parafilimonas terrae]SFQ49794.1 hypothetical protein SAMN05444277_11537 [Parafilimonas terrae]